MKKYSAPIALVILLLSASAAFSAVPIDANTNLAAGKSAYGAFSNAAAATDGKLKVGYATSGDISDAPQYLTIDLGASLYLDRVKIYWDKGAYSNDFAVRTSPNAKYWNEEAAGLDGANGVLDPASGAMVTSISLRRAILSSRYVQIMVPAGTKVTNASGNFVKIAELEVYPSVNQKFTLDAVDAYGATDTACMIKYKTSIGAAGGTVNYGTNPNKLDGVAGNSESGVDNSAVITGLKPKTTYFYQVKTTDFYGKSVSSAVKSFTTAGENVALKKLVTGTFIYLPVDKFVKGGSESEVLARVTDGGTSYFTSMATSGPVPSSDQYVVIDLGRSYRLNNIVSYWRRLAYPESLIVQVSDNSSDWKTIESGADAGSGAFARSDAGDPVKVVNTAGAPGRYIKLLVKKGSPFFHKHSEWNFVQLMEVKAFAQ